MITQSKLVGIAVTLGFALLGQVPAQAQLTYSGISSTALQSTDVFGNPLPPQLYQSNSIIVLKSPLQVFDPFTGVVTQESNPFNLFLSPPPEQISATGAISIFSAVETSGLSGGTFLQQFWQLHPRLANRGWHSTSTNPGGHIGRGVPDVAGNADPQTGYQIRVDGQLYVFGGTSAVAPLWAALLALINQQLGKPVGYLNPILYQQVAPTGALRDVTSGNNGGYPAKVGWDACTGLGAPDGTKLLQVLTGAKP